VFVLLYVRALSLRGTLWLDAYDLSVTRKEIRGFLLSVAVALASVALAALGRPGMASWAGMVYLLIFPLQTINGRGCGPAGENKE
jgi:hypothetical protein